MLGIYPVALQLASDAAKAATLIARKDPDLARQLRRASVSVPLIIAEGSQSRGRNRNARYSDALGSALETRACYDVAAAVDYIHEPENGVRERLAQVIGTLVKLTRSSDGAGRDAPGASQACWAHADAQVRTGPYW